MQQVTVKSYPALSYNDREIIRYMGARETNDEVAAMIADCKRECSFAFTPRVCYAVCDVSVGDGEVTLGDLLIRSRDLAKCLDGCEKAVVFTATVGFPIDRLIKKYSLLSPVRALIMSAIGTAQVETLCDMFADDMRNAYGDVRPRYGVGYGDFSLSYQTDIFSRLQVTHRLGVTLTDSLLMSPTKSVSAVIGIGACKTQGEGCARCDKKDCIYRG